EYVWSSSYDVGEMWSSRDINNVTPIDTFFTNLSLASNGPAASFAISVAGSAFNNRNFKVEVNGSSVVDTTINSLDAFVTNRSITRSTLALNNNSTVRISSLSSISTDRFVAGFVELTYPRNFNFGGQSNFVFTMPASSTNKFVEITNFNAGSTAPVLYDLTNNRRYVAEVSGGVIKIVLQPSSTTTNLVLVSQETTNATLVSTFIQRNFVNYTLTGNQGDYLIISHSSLQTTHNGADQVDQYRAYRASAAGGSFNAKIYDIDQIVDQYAFGIKKHPLSVKNFLKSTRNKFSVAPKFVLLLGKGLTYVDYRENQLSPRVDQLNLIPTWGWPASDVLLASDNMDPLVTTPIGRLSVIAPAEIFDYLNKVKQYEQAQANTNQTIENKSWMKNVVHVAGGNDPNLDLRLTQYFNGYENIIEDTLFGGNVTNFNRLVTGPVTPVVNAQMEQAFQKGISIIMYFGHSAATSFDYNLNTPQEYNNTGKYPMFIVNGCNAGDLFSFDTSRFSTLENLSEMWVLAKDKGSIGFIASTHFGVENYLNDISTGLYRSIGVTGYGKSIGFNMNEGTRYMLNRYGLSADGPRL
ncbi:MAG TPA: C25 family cysteine peptidase, partial [Segetibacter sp.]